MIGKKGTAKESRVIIMIEGFFIILQISARYTINTLSLKYSATLFTLYPALACYFP